MATVKKELFRVLEEYINNMDDTDIIALHNDYCDAVNGYDNSIYYMSEFDEIMSGVEPWEVARSAYYGDFRPCDEYFYFNGYGNLESGDFIEQLPIYTLEIAEYIADNGDSLYNDDIQEIIDEYEEVGDNE